MKTIDATNVNDAFHTAINDLANSHTVRDSRNGPIIAFHGPVLTRYRRPTERVLFHPKRNANPFFHFYESLWMLAGRNDVDSVARIVKRMREFSDDGKTFHGAYGYRWRHFFRYDQLEWIVGELRANPQTRRAVMSMWNGMRNMGDPSVPEHDLYVAGHGGKDVPCNTHIYFDCRGGVLNMTVCNRSNDIVWGCYGANAVHMSFLQEYVAARVGIPVGDYYQFSNDLHLYTEVIDIADFVDLHPRSMTDYYDVAPPGHSRPLFTYPLNKGRENEETVPMELWERDLIRFTDVFANDPSVDLRMITWLTPFFNDVAAPMMATWSMRKARGSAHGAAADIKAEDWRFAARHWVMHNGGDKK